MAQAQKRKTSGKTGTSTRRKAPSKASRSARKASRKKGKNSTENNLFLPLLTLWIVALVVLASLLYWGRGSYMPLLRRSGVPTARSPEGEEPHRSARSVVRERRSSRGAAAEASRSRSESSRKGEGGSSSSESGKPRALASVAPRPLPPPTEPSLPKKPPVGRVAIVIDDFGQDLRMARRFLSIPIPITFSVIPHLEHSREIAELAHVNGHEVIVHMPMEPEGYPEKNPGPGALLVSMGPDEIARNLESALQENPHARGMNNHMGSRFTAEKRRMRTVLAHLKRRGLYFFDSYTSAKSVGLRLARKMGVPSVKRDIFLDHVQTESFVRKQIRELIRKAKIQGRAVAIGHPYPVTLKVLREEALLFEKEGIEVVPLSRIIYESEKKKSLRGKVPKS